MKAKHSLSMSKGLLLMCLGLVFGARAAAQDLWREGPNVSGLSFYTESSAQASLYGKYTSGELKDPSEARELWIAGAAAQAETHFKDLVLTGQFSFEQASAQDMMGSMFTRPGSYPIDVLEFTPGPKLMQTYGIGGGLAWINGSRWVPGATLRFEGVNYSKRKDIRHTTYRQEVELLPSLLYKAPDWAAGATLRLEKTSEFIQAEQLGAATSESYYAFLDKGMRYGSYQVWDGSGIHLKEAGVDRLPVKELTMGAGLQASWKDLLYIQAHYDRSSGEKGYTWFRVPGATAGVTLALALHGSEGTHMLKAELGWARKDNYESVIEKITSGGVTTPVEYGDNRIYALRELSFDPGYHYYGNNGFQIISALHLFYDRQLSTLLYPFMDHDEAMHLKWDVDTEIPLGKHFLLKGGALLRGKIGEHRHYIDRDDENLGVNGSPLRLESWWDPEQEVADATRFGALFALRYNFFLPGGNPLFVEAEWKFLHALNITLLPGSNRQCATLTLGYSF